MERVTDNITKKAPFKKKIYALLRMSEALLRRLATRYSSKIYIKVTGFSYWYF
jgi:hypothetical protein